MPRYRIRTPLRRPLPGGRKNRRSGESLDFMELRGYTPGDDLRFVDWKAYARSGRLYTRVWEGEERTRFSFFFDTSASMGLWGKGQYAGRILDTLIKAALPEETYLLTAKGPVHVRRPREYEHLLRDAPKNVFAAGSLQKAKGQLLIISDALDQGDWAALARRLQKHSPVLVHILASQEIEPPPREAEWRDVESGARKRVGRPEITRYRAGIQKHLASLRKAFRRYGDYVGLLVGDEIIPSLRRQKLLEWR